MNTEAIIKRIKEGRWELRVRRPGFLQSKQIVCVAQDQPIKLTPRVTVHEKTNICVGDLFLYNQDTIDALMSHVFADAFAEDAQWPLAVLQELKKAAREKDDFISRSSAIRWADTGVTEKSAYFAEYVALLSKIQKYYAFAVPLTNCCEHKLKESDESLLEYAVQHEMLDVDKMNESLARIKSVSGEEREPLLREHLERFAWIKSNYNITEPYTREEVLNELLSDIHVFNPKLVPEGPYAYLATGLQVGIFLRNSMKEMSQQLWFSLEPFIRHVARDLSISREDALQLRPDELLASLRSGKITLSPSEIQDRHCGFVAGVLDGEAILLTGPVVQALITLFDSPDTAGIREIRGNVASKGLIRGVAKVIPRISDIGILEDGDILVTSMTTPDFVVAMKRAGAIVTDEGGLSCHAAIVSRELKKPCVIGTKIASKVIKSGDMVEVDAQQGIVTILERA